MAELFTISLTAILIENFVLVNFWVFARFWAFQSASTRRSAWDVRLRLL